MKIALNNISIIVVNKKKHNCAKDLIRIIKDNFVENLIDFNLIFFIPRISLFLKHLHCGKRKKKEKRIQIINSWGPCKKKTATEKIVGH